MLFMVIEKFRNRDAKAIYRRFRDQGRMTPDGLKYVGSWIEANFDRCFQLMECDDPRLLQDWLLGWGDLVEFEIVPVVPSDQTRELVLIRVCEKLNHMTALMQGKRGLIMGVANDHSIAWGIAKTLSSHGATLAFTYQGEALGKRVKPLAESLGSKLVMPCDVEDIASVDAVFARGREAMGHAGLPASTPSASPTRTS